ncbi:unnamed protein product [Didymodactylos carnosus]|uniref:Ubiquitin-like protease family profile domain-containing protein n=1 Tax=Didymodactylos carnosus TaxID=1234261 RepID=A0A813SMT9_9BILA|nr:unnamed protein product [Didymodactylos carnosus]CAF0802888.1 unnamed protein product [Didymodactylos carnosus]CAF3553847.1 unnamed protein product [Didymodactylos carnosus]CAF3588094.1 unnamed protein product [Didymodactylos carnosus]
MSGTNHTVSEVNPGSNDIELYLQRIITERANTTTIQPIDIILPINLDRNHWTLLIICYSDDISIVMYPDIYYIDPLSHSIHNDVLEGVRKSGIVDRGYTVIETPKIILQRDGRNCGPWICCCAQQWIATGQFNFLDLQKLNMLEVRGQHVRIFPIDSDD